MPLSRVDWQNVMRRHNELGAESDKAYENDNDELGSRLDNEIEDVVRRYYEALPAVVMGTCPYDGIPVVRKIDPYGFEGLWWQNPVAAEDRPSCIHFVAVRGAINFGGNTPRGTNSSSTAHIGPDVPFVIPRLLKREGVIAVIGELTLDPGYLAYTITYFGDPLPLPEHRVADWCEEHFTFVMADGSQRWRSDEDRWDFKLRPWLRRGKLRWCVPGSDNRVLAVDPPDLCPYLDLPGDREAQIVDEDGVYTSGTPDDEPGQPIDV